MMSVYLVLLMASALAVATGQSPMLSRISVVRNHVTAGGGSDIKFMAFASSKNTGPGSPNGMLIMSTSSDGGVWSKWSAVDTAVITSNPVAVSFYDATSEGYFISVYVQSENGQVTAYIQSPSNATTFKPTQVSSDIPSDLSRENRSTDPLQAVVLKNRTYVFVRSQSKNSQVYWNSFNDSTLRPLHSKWPLVGDDKNSLKYDPFAAVNEFLGRIEVFGVFENNDVLHSWQNSETSFEDRWEKLGSIFSPKFNSVPAVHQMGHSDFNGVLSLFVRGEDGVMHHVAQTTCIKSATPWGPCTWGAYSKLGGSVPAISADNNPFTVNHNIHRGIEVFVLGKSDGHLYHIWQRERDGSWSDWEKLGPLTPTSGFNSQPAILTDDYGWWQAFAVNSTMLVSRYLQTPLKFTLSTDSVTYNKNVTVSWAIPNDQATHKDWIGVYPKGALGHGYVDFAYVGGTQNPLKDPVPHGSVNFQASLPNGTYTYQYMVNKEYDAVFVDSLNVVGAPQELEWVQVYQGIARGLGNLDVNVSECVEDGNHTIVTFRAAFDAFENRKIFEGLHLIAEGLSDFRDALIDCNETEIVKDLTRFISDLISCTESNCVQFLIDIGIELTILYEHVYEIFGDIQGASNSFKIDAYEQGGLCIGRVTWACLQLE